MSEVMQRTAARAAAEPDASLSVRPLRSPEDYAASVRLQLETWGPDYREVVPASVLKLAQGLGGVASGAFDAAGALVGFVFGMTGVSDGRLVHWSHMLAVGGGQRNLGVGRRLKEHQRALLRDAGVAEIRWTFDPLVARNGHLNLNVLGATVVDYLVDAYGNTGSDLHTFGTDRLVVSWPVDPDAAPPRPTEAALRELAARAPLLNAPPGEPSPVGDGAWSVPCLRVQVPADVEAMRHDQVALARAWRASTRHAFRAAFGHGYRVSGFLGGRGEPGAYLLWRRAA